MQKFSFGEPTLADILLKMDDQKEDKMIGFDPKFCSIGIKIQRNKNYANFNTTICCFRVY